MHGRIHPIRRVESRCIFYSGKFFTTSQFFHPKAGCARLFIQLNEKLTFVKRKSKNGRQKPKILYFAGLFKKLNSRDKEFNLHQYAKRSQKIVVLKRRNLQKWNKTKLDLDVGVATGGKHCHWRQAWPLEVSMVTGGKRGHWRYSWLLELSVATGVSGATGCKRGHWRKAWLMQVPWDSTGHP